MPEWCPKCHTILPEGLDNCPRCGKKIPTKRNQNFTWKDIFSISTNILAIVVIPVVFMIFIGILCTVFGNYS